METTSLNFGKPLWFLALLLLPAFALFFWWGHRRGMALLHRVVAPRLYNQLIGSVSRPLRILRDILLLSVIALLILTLAQPRLGVTSIKAPQLGRDVIIAVDTSRSMLATDLAPNRLARTKLFGQDLVNLLHGDRLGLIAFAGTAFLQAPLTTDYGAILNSLKELDTNTIPRGGTNITSAIQIAEEAFGHAEGATRALILVSDGEDLEADAIFEAKRAAAQGIRIFTVGVGSATGSLLPITTDEGQQDFVRDANGKPVMSRLDETRLKEIAESSGGFYSNLTPSTAQEIFHKGIQPLTERQGQAITSSRPIERFEWTLIPAILFLATWWLLGDRRRRMQHSGSSSAILFFAIFVGSTISVHAQSGLKSYEKGDYQKALKNFESYTRQRPSLAEAFFDAGTAAYRLGDYEKALDFFGKSVLGKNVPLRTKAQYNMGNALVRKGEAASTIDQKKALWKAAIQQYDQVLKQEPKNTLADDNKKLVEKMLEELDRKKNQQNPQNRQQQDQKNSNSQDQQDKQNQQKQQNEQKQQPENQKQDQQNQQQQDQSNPPNQPPPQQQQQQEQQKNPQSPQQDQQKQQNPQNQQGSSSNSSSPTPPKKGPIGEMGKQQQQQQGGSEPAASTESGGKTLTRDQANTLIDSMEGEEQRLKPAGQTTPPDIYKDW